MDPALMFEPLINVGPGDDENDLLKAAEIRRAGIERLDLPSPGLGVAGVNAKEVGPKEGGLRAAGAGADLDDGVARIRRVGRKHLPLHLQGKAFLFGFEMGDLFPGQGGQFGAGGLALQQGAVGVELGERLAVSGVGGGQFLEPGEFPGQLLGPLLVAEDRRVAQGRFQLGQALGELVKVGTQVHKDGGSRRPDKKNAPARRGALRVDEGEVARPFFSWTPRRPGRLGRPGSWPGVAGICPRARRYRRISAARCRRGDRGCRCRR